MLSAGLIVAGWDDTAGPSVWAIPLGGTLIQVPFTVGGTISSCADGHNLNLQSFRESVEIFSQPGCQSECC